MAGYTSAAIMEGAMDSEKQPAVPCKRCSLETCATGNRDCSVEPHPCQPTRCSLSDKCDWVRA